jgi:hypothetical protein
MEHVVFYPSVDNLPAFRRLDSIDEAVRFVEHLRNVEGVSECSVHALTPVPVSFRAYYRAEVPAEPTAAASVATVSAPVVTGQAEPANETAAEELDEASRVEVPAPAEPVGDETAATDLGEAKTLGFFAR